MRKLPRRILIGLGLLLLLVALVGVVAYELVSSALEAKYLVKTAQKMTWQVRPGPSTRIRFPGPGPYDVRLGYHALPDFLTRLDQAGWQIDEQARISIQMARAHDLGLFLPYREKDQAGLTLLDSDGKTLYRSAHPMRVYQRFQDIPPVLVNALLYIENRELLAEQFPTRNPAVEWDRLAQALMEKGISLVDTSRNVPGGSTLPTQIEKYRHSTEGLTTSMSEKLRQMATASLRAYLDGPNTLPMRRNTVMAYLNTVPLAAAPRFGEVNGIGDGLWAWYGLDFAEINKTLAKEPHAHDAAYASALKHALSLVVAERRPSYYLSANRKALDALTDDHLDLLASAGVISRPLAELAKRVELRGPHHRIDPPAPRFVDQKATNAQRIRLAQLLGEHRLYDLDRLDLQARTTINQPAQKIVSRYLQSLASPDAVAASGLFGFRLLQPQNTLSHVIYSFTLYEKTPQGNALRVQADNLNQPFDINSQARLDLGSTAKLRTLVTYLQIISRLYDEDRTLDPAALRQKAQPQRDVLAQWVAATLLAHPDITRSALLDAAMGRQYSAAREMFFTGGGLHDFVNFDAKDNTRVMDVWEATKNSVNLVYIRIMRDIVRHYATASPGAAARILDDASNPLRQTYLMRFVDQEGRVFTSRFYQRHKGQTANQMAEDLYARVHANPRRFTSVYRYLEPQAGFEAYVQALHAHVPESATLSPKTLEALYKTHGPDAYNLTDRGYVTQIHPLELWVVKTLRNAPLTDLKTLDTQGADVRREVYNWLFKTSRKNAQDIRIQSLLEVEAFDGLLRDWKRLGYPFDNITPSYATAIGASGDRPAALAELMGILVNDGVRAPTASLTGLHFAADTPYDTRLSLKPTQGQRLLPIEVAQTVRRALARVVEGGTAGRLAGALKDAAGQPIVMGGKTGTGDHRFETYGKGGQLIESRVVSRSATFVFYLGDRYFGTMTAVVEGEEAGQFGFTSSLTAQMLKILLPQLQPHLHLQGAPIHQPAPAAAAKPAVAPPPAPVKETPDDTTSRADPALKEQPSPGGFPEKLEPGVVIPVPPAPAQAPAGPPVNTAPPAP
ncbi:transglycosylase domain-containing protein [Thiobacillus sedimenti]|uniref:peptidoglycan glycosyltransferase n=1 Tax=Thiobacillus sedimenti TaxID=3110231 RepID=A0ABZ1CI57_9PROT|nr:transglycosylase domain-containing protein [Thiobacillus sp. SCUT-2]WRS38932.1 transglycosylase domain-containing protein [Thiobacillus sp. SCUT-2]